MTANEIQIGGEHYRHSDYQHWDWAWDSGLDSFQYPITKYVARHKRKNGVEDLEKAEHYLTKYMEVLPSTAKSRTNDPNSEFFFKWSNSEKLDPMQHDICLLAVNYSEPGNLEKALDMLRGYREAEYGGEPGAGYVDQDRQDATVAVAGVGTTGEGGMAPTPDKVCAHPQINRVMGKCEICGEEI